MCPLCLSLCQCTGSVFPNASTPSRDALAEMVLNCRNSAHGGCLYNVEEDPSEYVDLADTETVLLSEMKSRLSALSEDVFVATPHGLDSCPEDIEDDFCGCWMAQHNYDYAVGPYQDLSDFQKAFLRIHDEQFGGDNHAREKEVHLYIILIIIVCSLVIVVSSCYYCYRWDRRIERSKKLFPEKEKEREALLSEYGAVDVGAAAKDGDVLQYEREREYAHDCHDQIGGQRMTI